VPQALCAKASAAVGLTAAPAVRAGRACTSRSPTTLAALLDHLSDRVKERTGHDKPDTPYGATRAPASRLAGVEST
jgi:cytidylate kinase